MRYPRILATILALIFAVSCAIDNLEVPEPDIAGSGEISVIGHVARFDDYDVSTKGAKQGNEGKIHSFAMAIFPVNESENGVEKCVFFQANPSANQLLFNITRDIYTQGKRYAIYLFANMPAVLTFGVGDTLEEMLNATLEVKNLDIPETGIPMIGSLGDTFSHLLFDVDGKTLVISPTNGEEPPTVNGSETSTLDIPMKALYAKMNFEIEVRPDQMIEGNYAPQFQLESYTLVNVPASVDFNKATNSDQSTSIGVLEDQQILTGNVVASGANKIKFSFYLPENLFTPGTQWDQYKYPFGKGSDIREQDLKYRQRYKVKLLSEYDSDGNVTKDGSNRPATNIILTGTFRDHQSHEVKIDYTIYLGRDNYNDFNIVRNGEYDNKITIRGILNSDHNANDFISLDHRVNITHKEPVIISLRREVLLDSHFEIRPLRIKANTGFNGNINPTHVQVQVVNPTTTDWMRIERSYGNGEYDAGEQSIYIHNNVNSEYASNGKRKYFTHNLVKVYNQNANDVVNSIQNNTVVVVPIPEKSNDNECVWIYVDECLNVGDGVRSGIINLKYGTLNEEGEFDPIESEEFPDINYTINQRKLFPIIGVRGDKFPYYIEYEEEYLHNFDSEDAFGETDDEGMEWGLDGLQLSYENPAVHFDGGDWDDFGAAIQNAFTSSLKPYYDFYVQKHDGSMSGTMRSYAGFDFCNEIIQVINGQGQHNLDPTDNIDVLPLNEQARSAVEYCFNKNKRDADGHVVTGTSAWYLPAVDEIEDIVMGQYLDPDDILQYSYLRFEDFQNKFYWSSQPSYQRHYAYYRGVLTGISHAPYYIDDKNYARATKVNYIDGRYNYDLSGVVPDTYYTAWYHWEAWIANTDYTQWPEGTQNIPQGDRTGNSFIQEGVNITLGPVQRQPGNKPRTGADGMARVRCVRHMN